MSKIYYNNIRRIRERVERSRLKNKTVFVETHRVLLDKKIIYKDADMQRNKKFYIMIITFMKKTTKS